MQRFETPKENERPVKFRLKQASATDKQIRGHQRGPWMIALQHGPLHRRCSAAPPALAGAPASIDDETAAAGCWTAPGRLYRPAMMSGWSSGSRTGARRSRAVNPADAACSGPIHGRLASSRQEVPVLVVVTSGCSKALKPSALTRAPFLHPAGRNRPDCGRRSNSYTANNR
jgi:hypothetical protein